MKGIFLAIFFAFIFFISNSNAQGFKQLYIDENQNGKPLIELLSEIETNYNVSFIYDDDVLEGLTVFGVGRKYKVDDFLNVFLPTHKAVKLSNSEMNLQHMAGINACGTYRRHPGGHCAPFPYTLFIGAGDEMSAIFMSMIAPICAIRKDKFK